MQAKQITNLTEKEIGLLLDNDMPFAIDRAKFEDYITGGTGQYEYSLDHYEPVTGHRESHHVIPMDEYWAAIGQAQIEHINDYIEQSPEVQKDLALADIEAFVKWEMNKDSYEDIALLKSKVLYFGHKYFLYATHI